MVSSENSKELHSTDQPEFEAGNVADQKVNDTADEKAEAAANGKIEAAADEKVDVVADGKGDAAVDSGVFTPAPNPTVEVNKTFLAVGANKDTPAAATTCFIKLVNVVLYIWTALTFMFVQQFNIKASGWLCLIEKGSGHVQVNGKTISKYSFCFLNSGDEVVLSQAENNAYIVQLLLESPSDVGTSAGKGKLLTIENQVEDALAIARHIFEPGAMQTKPCIGIYIEKGRGAVPLFSNFEATVG
ncbi:hypothetical protein CQW23_33782 [Capsicum baccatum]|uniref:Uncharacterized protein n=1 Tax=Capsicum baccatum TaxID=33114 RepID=A0A2G2V135_CAPBA|nr:hypothetical protein CQW23_33782 [Capsicum baccatum]